MQLASQAIVNSLATVDSRSLESRDPMKAMLTLEMLSSGNTWEEIANETGWNFDQISRVRARHGMAIDQRKKELAQDGFEMAEGLRLLVKQKMEQLANNPEALAKTNLKDLVLPYAIAVDKGMQALGEQKTIVEHRTGRPSLEDAIKAIEDARLALQKEAIPVDSIDITKQ